MRLPSTTAIVLLTITTYAGDHLWPLVTGPVVVAIAPMVAAAIISLGLKGIGSFFGRRAQNAQTNENNRAQTAALTLQQRQREDQRRARLAFGQGLLGRVPSTVGESAASGNHALDPTLYANLDRERTYDFSSTAAAPRGGTSAFLSGLFNSGADVAPYLMPGAHSEDNTGLNAPTVPPDSGVDLSYLQSLARTAPRR